MKTVVKMTAIACIFALGLFGLVACGSSQAASSSASAGGESESAASAGESSESVASTVSAGVAVKSSLDDYTWEELSKISAEIGASSDRDAVAKKYNLLNSKGQLDGTQIKKLENEDYGWEVALMGYDENGLAFIATTSWAEWDFGVYGYYGDSNGYSKSEIRKCLNDELLPLLPKDLSSVIKSVSKQNFSGTSCTDKLWIPSMAELGVNVDYENGKNEGPAYKLFEDAASRGDSSVLLRTSDGEKATSWWTRSMKSKSKVPLKNSNDYQVKIGFVSSSGEIYDDFANAGHEMYGVVPCFYV